MLSNPPPPSQATHYQVVMLNSEGYCNQCCNCTLQKNEDIDTLILHINVIVIHPVFLAVHKQLKLSYTEIKLKVRVSYKSCCS